MKHLRIRASLLLLATLLLTMPARAALPNPDHEDIDYILEHVPESGMDARYVGFPWPGRRLESGTWQTTLQAGYANTAASFLRLDGPLLSGSATYSFRDRWAVAGIGFYDAITISGDRGREVLNPFFVHPPLDLPEFADFSNPRGDYLYWGAGAALLWKPTPAGADRWWTFEAGLLWSRLDLDNFAVDYTVATGRSAGASGVLDHSLHANYATPFVGLQWNRPLGSRFLLSPRALAVVPLPPADFPGRITGPGFDLSSDSPGGRAGQIGDAFLDLGLEIQHLPTGLALDLGSALYFAGAESITHPGVSRAVTFQLIWHR
jgi:hypothetical protein